MIKTKGKSVIFLKTNINLKTKNENYVFISKFLNVINFSKI